MWTITCVIFGCSLTGLAGSLLSDDPLMAWGVEAVCAWWMLHGSIRLKEGGWRPSFGRDGAIWIVKDSLAMLIWPILYNWIARRAEKE